MAANNTLTQADDMETELRVTLHFTDDTTGVWVTSLESLTKKSPYFAAMLNFKEGKEGTVEIVDVDYAGFTLVLKWHDSKVDSSWSYSVPAKKNDAIKRHLDLSPARKLMHAYMVADRLMLQCYQEKALRRLKNPFLSHPITTADILYAQSLGVSDTSPLMICLLRRMGWQWSYTEDGKFENSRPDPLILQGGELAWELLNKFWQAHHWSGKNKQPNMYDEYHLQGKSKLPGIGIARLMTIQNQSGTADSDYVRSRIEYTVQQLRGWQRDHRLDMHSKKFIVRGGPLVWEFVKLYVASCRCRLRSDMSDAGSLRILENTTKP